MLHHCIPSYADLPSGHATIGIVLSPSPEAPTFLESRMTQKRRNENARVVCLFCGTPTFVPQFPSLDTHDEGDLGAGITLVRCHICRKEAPYAASEIFSIQEIPPSEDSTRTRAAGL